MSEQSGRGALYLTLVAVVAIVGMVAMQSGGSGTPSFADDTSAMELFDEDGNLLGEARKRGRTSRVRAARTTSRNSQRLAVTQTAERTTPTVNVATELGVSEYNTNNRLNLVAEPAPSGLDPTGGGGECVPQQTKCEHAFDHDWNSVGHFFDSDANVYRLKNSTLVEYTCLENATWQMDWPLEVCNAACNAEGVLGRQQDVACHGDKGKAYCTYWDGWHTTGETCSTPTGGNWNHPNTW